jgi:SAM-dependent methyltransferase
LNRSQAAQAVTDRNAPNIRRIATSLDALNRRWRAWPGSIVRDPALTEPHYLQHRRLILALASAVERHLHGATGQLIVDIGAGKRPYYPLFAEHCGRYVGVDLPGTPGSDVHGATEHLPLKSESCDIVVSTQMLEHAEDPERTLHECQRILKPGGLMIASTHGAAYFHPIPVDHWRWTHSGLRLIFERAGFDVLSVDATTRTLTTFATLAAEHFLGTAHRIRMTRLAAQLLVPFNWLIARIDGVNRHPPIPDYRVAPGALPWTYLVVGRKPRP